MDWMRISRFFWSLWMISMDWLSSSHRGIRAWEKDKKWPREINVWPKFCILPKMSHPHMCRQTWSKPWQLDTSLRTFSSAKSRDRSSSRSLFSRVNMSHLKPNARRWNSAWKDQKILALWCLDDTTIYIFLCDWDGRVFNNERQDYCAGGHVGALTFQGTPCIVIH